jgi:predicted transcriptional regulator
MGRYCLVLPFTSLSAICRTAVGVVTRSKKPLAPVPIGNVDHVFIDGVNALGPMEAKVMLAAWSASGPVSGKHMVSFVQKTYGEWTPYTSVLSTAIRPAEKGYLRQDTSSKAYMFIPTVTREQYEERIARCLMEVALHIRPALRAEDGLLIPDK